MDNDKLLDISRIYSQATEILNELSSLLNAYHRVNHPVDVWFPLLFPMVIQYVIFKITYGEKLLEQRFEDPKIPWSYGGIESFSVCIWDDRLGEAKTTTCAPYSSKKHQGLQYRSSLQPIGLILLRAIRFLRRVIGVHYKHPGLTIFNGRMPLRTLLIGTPYHYSELSFSTGQADRINRSRETISYVAGLSQDALRIFSRLPFAIIDGFNEKLEIAKRILVENRVKSLHTNNALYFSDLSFFLVAAKLLGVKITYYQHGINYRVGPPGTHLRSEQHVADNYISPSVYSLIGSRMVNLARWSRLKNILLRYLGSRKLDIIFIEPIVKVSYSGVNYATCSQVFSANVNIFFSAIGADSFAYAKVKSRPSNRRYCSLLSVAEVGSCPQPCTLHIEFELGSMFYELLTLGVPILCIVPYKIDYLVKIFGSNTLVNVAFESKLIFHEPEAAFRFISQMSAQDCVKWFASRPVQAARRSILEAASIRVTSVTN